MLKERRSSIQIFFAQRPWCNDVPSVIPKKPREHAFSLFFIYGIAQAGSHLIWNLSGTFFAAEQDSSLYTRVNILMLGIRGAVMPLIGGLLCDWIGPVPILLLDTLLCLCGTRYLFQRTKVVTSQS